MIYDLIPITIAGIQTHCRPFEFDDNSNPTAVVVSHTTCPSCSGRVVVNHITCDNLINVNNVNYIYCTDCDYGKEEFQNMKDIGQGRVVYESAQLQVCDDCECDFEAVMSIPLIDRSATEFVNNLNNKYIKQEEIPVNSHKDIIQKMVK